MNVAPIRSPRLCEYCDSDPTGAIRVVSGVDIDYCPEHFALALARAEQLLPVLLDQHREGGSWRHWLDGKPVHCGSRLELELEEGEYSRCAACHGRGYSAVDRLDCASCKGEGEVFVERPRWVPARYEASIWSDRIVATLVIGRLTSGEQLEARVPRLAHLRWPSDG